jgi:thiosulfate dehydrogenase
MHGINMFSVFTWRFMPKSAPSLTPEQALDVAGFVHEQPRPKFVATHPDKIKQNIPLEKGK